MKPKLIGNLQNGLNDVLVFKSEQQNISGQNKPNVNQNNLNNQSPMLKLQAIQANQQNKLLKRLPPIRYTNGSLEDTPELETIFKNMCRPEEQKYRNPLLHIENLRSFLLQRYDSNIADKIIQYFNFNNAMRLPNYLEKLNKFLWSDMQTKLKFCFDLYDHNTDGKICLVDLFKSLKLLTEDDFFIKNEIAFITRIIMDKIKREDLEIQNSKDSMKKRALSLEKLQLMNGISIKSSKYGSALSSQNSSPEKVKYEFQGQSFLTKVQNPYENMGTPLKPLSKNQFDFRSQVTMKKNKVQPIDTQQNQTSFYVNSSNSDSKTSLSRIKNTQQRQDFVYFVANSVKQKNEQNSLLKDSNNYISSFISDGSSLKQSDFYSTQYNTVDNNTYNLLGYNNNQELQNTQSSTLYDNVSDTYFTQDKKKIKSFDLENMFDNFTSLLKTTTDEKEYLILSEFINLKFERDGYPEILHDILLYLADYKIIKQQEQQINGSLRGNQNQSILHKFNRKLRILPNFFKQNSSVNNEGLSVFRGEKSSQIMVNSKTGGNQSNFLALNIKINPKINLSSIEENIQDNKSKILQLGLNKQINQTPEKDPYQIYYNNLKRQIKRTPQDPLLLHKRKNKFQLFEEAFNCKLEKYQ
eukprot:403336461